MDPELFRKELLSEINQNISKLMTSEREWTVKGFIDILSGFTRYADFISIANIVLSSNKKVRSG